MYKNSLFVYFCDMDPEEDPTEFKQISQFGIYGDMFFFVSENGPVFMSVELIDKVCLFGNCDFVQDKIYKSYIWPFDLVICSTMEDKE